eukprot:scaffold932_cov328-Pavlova_lutheri.AAC.14
MDAESLVTPLSSGTTEWYSYRILGKFGSASGPNCANFMYCLTFNSCLSSSDMKKDFLSTFPLVCLRFGVANVSPGPLPFSMAGALVHCACLCICTFVFWDRSLGTKGAAWTFAAACCVLARLAFGTKGCASAETLGSCGNASPLADRVSSSRSDIPPPSRLGWTACASRALAGAHARTVHPSSTSCAHDTNALEQPLETHPYPQRNASVLHRVSSTGEGSRPSRRDPTR